MDELKNKIRTIPNWPKSGIMFRDITTLFQDAESLKKVADLFFEHYKNKSVEKIVGIESRGFIIGAILADRLGVGFVPIRKKGKLPYTTYKEEYDLEYGTDQIEMHIDAVKNNERVLIIDDLLATGGTALAACKLIKQAGGNIVGCGFIINLVDLGGIKKLKDLGCDVFSLLEFEGL